MAHEISHFSLKHPTKYIGRKPRKYTIPAKALGSLPSPIEVQDDIDGQVRMYRKPSSGALHPSQYTRVSRDLETSSVPIWPVSSFQQIFDKLKYCF